MTIATGTVASVVQEDLIRATFDRYDLDAYQGFLAWKRLPERELSYDWQTDSYTLSTPARFAPLLGVSAPPVQRARVAYASHLFDYQAFVVERALHARRYAAWLDTGLGKTAVFLEWARQVLHAAGGRVLILAPLQVIPQIQDEAARFYGGTIGLEYLPTRAALAEWCRLPGKGVALTNYEKLIPGVMPELRYLAGLVADESSILRSGGGVIKWNLIKSARGIEYKLSSTATPAPNDSMEYASQASFLEKLRTEGDILWTFFRRDKHGEWVIKPHAREAFYRFMASWSVYMRDPAAFGFADVLADLPDPVIQAYPLPLHDEQREPMYELLTRRGKGLFPDDRLGVQERAKLSQLAKGFLYTGAGKERRAQRVPSAKPGFVTDLVRQEVAAGRQVLVWTVFDEESALLAELLDGAPFTVAALHGSMPVPARAEVLGRFRRGDVDVLISKSVLVGFGLNFQFCRSMVFSGFDDSFERLYQAVRRCYRYGQTETVHVHVPYIPELEGAVLENLQRKQAQFEADTAMQESYYREALGLSTEEAA